MAYSDFSLKRALDEFGLEIVEKHGMFARLEAAPLSAYFLATLEENLPLAIPSTPRKPAPNCLSRRS